MLVLWCERDELAELLYDAAACLLVVPVLPDLTVPLDVALFVVPAGLRWFDTVLLVALVTDLRSVEAVLAVRLTVVLPLDAAAVETLLTRCSELLLLTLLLLPAPPLVETLLVNTLSDPVDILLPCQRSLSWTGTAG